MAALDPIAKSAIGRRSSTAARGDPAYTMPQELDVLGAHAEDCESGRDRFFDLRCQLDAARSFVASRVVSTFLLTAVVLALVFWLLD